MKKIWLILAIFSFSLHANIKNEVYSLYQNHNYDEACKKGLRYLNQYRQDEQFVTLYAFSCLEADYIDRLAIPISILKRTEESRANAAYLATILMQKKMLIHALMDHYDISSLELPTTEYVLSIVFDLYTKRHNPNQKHAIYIFRDPKNEKISYKLYMTKKNGTNKMVIETYYDTMMTQRHTYR